MLISPLILVRLLTVEEFGRYREFLLYSTILVTFAGFGINTSLLRFIPHQPTHGWRFVDQSVLMTLVISTIVTVTALLVDAATHGAVLGGYGVPVALYVALFVNLDFWEYLWLAQRRSVAVLGYTSGRLIARIVAVVTAAFLSRNVNVIIWSLVGLEAVRLTISFFAWRSQRPEGTGRLDGSWREQMRFCLPFGGSLMLVTLNRQIGNLFVAKMAGPVGLAHYAVGTYVHPIIGVLRNSISDVLLPEMVESNVRGQPDRLGLWRRTTVVVAIFLFAAGVILANFAEVIITTVFSAKYRGAVLIFQVYLLVLIRECMDFGVPLRAINRTGPILRSNLLAFVVNAALLAIALPTVGLVGAVGAFVVSRAVEGIYLGRQTLTAYQISLRSLASWGELGKVALAALLAASVLYGKFWTDTLGLAGVLVGSLIYVIVFMGLLWVLRVPEFLLIMRRMKGMPQAFLTRS